MRDIQTRADIELLMNKFYEQALSDPTIGYLFSEVARLDLDSHLPVICDFWETVILKSGNYKKNVLDVHLKLNEKSALKQAHFQQWLLIFRGTIESNFEGVNAENMKIRAESIATVMQIKINKH